MIKKRDKKGISVMIGYILLISISIVISIIVFQWISTYVPKESLGCNDGVSVFVESYTYSCDSQTLSLTLKNNGRFDVSGYFIHATTAPDQELAITDLSGSTDRGQGGSVVYPPNQNNFNTIFTGISINDVFDLSALSGCSGDGRCIYSIEIIPIRFEVVENRNRPVGCSEARIREPLECTAPPECTLSDNSECSEPSAFCDTDNNVCVECTINANCDEPAGEVCVSNQCSLLCGNSNPTDSGEECDGGGGCIDCTCDSANSYTPYSPTQVDCQLLCGNGILDTGEQCDFDGGTFCSDGTTTNSCTCETGYIPGGGTSINCVAAPDLVIDNNLANLGVNRQGDGNADLLISFNINNDGTTNSGTFQWGMSDSTTPATNDPKTGNIIDVGSGSFAPAEGTLSYLSRPVEVTVILTADSANPEDVIESNETNNILSIDIDCSSLANSNGASGSGPCTISITP